MIYYYADVLLDGRVRACFSYDMPEMGPHEPVWQYQSQGTVVLLDGPINWSGPHEDAVLHYIDGQLVWKDDRAFTQVQQDAIQMIDSEADTVRGKLATPEAAMEYSRTEAVAKAFKDSNYQGVAPSSVLSWANAKNWTVEQATDDILRAAGEYHASLDAIRDVRLTAKEAVRQAATLDEVNRIELEYRQALKGLVVM